jgi:hypothetical protein
MECTQLRAKDIDFHRREITTASLDSVPSTAWIAGTRTPMHMRTVGGH